MAEAIGLRLMREEDLTEVALIERQSFSSTWSRSHFLEEMKSPRSFMVVAEVLNEIVGYAGMRCVGPEMHVIAIAVKPGWREKGVGRVLLAHLIKEGVKRGAKEGYLEVRVGNVPARNLYTKAGFAPVGIRRNYYPVEREDALVMASLDLKRSLRLLAEGKEESLRGIGGDDAC